MTTSQRWDVEPEETPQERRRHRIFMQRLAHECRYLWMIRRTALYAAVEHLGYLRGRMGVWYRKCPVKRDGVLHAAWMTGWGRGREEFEAMRKPPPRPGPKGGRRVRKVA